MTTQHARYVCCDFCMTAYRCRGDVWRRHEDTQPICPVCSQPMLREAAISHAYTEVDGDQYAGAILFGMPRNPEEADCSLVTLLRRISQQGGGSVQLCMRQADGAHRSILEKVVLADGTSLHVGACPEGAVIYRVERA